MATVHADRVQPQVRSQVQSQERGIQSARVVLLAFAGVIVVGLALDLTLLEATGLLAQVVAGVEGLPKGVLVGSSVLLLAIAIPTGRWETQRLWKAHLQRVRERRIESLWPLAQRLGISPFALDRVTVQMLHDLSPKDFEFAMGDLLRLQGYRDVMRTGRAGDLCVDLTAIARDGKRIVAQCKRYAPERPVGSPDVQTFLGMVEIHHHVPMGLYFTTSSYTREATRLAAAHPNRLHLYDGDDLVQMVRELAVG